MTIGKKIISAQTIEWQMFGGSQNLHRFADMKFDSSAKLLWTFNNPAGISTPVFMDNKLFATGFDGKIFIFNLHSGAPEKIIDVCAESITSPPMVYNDNLYFGTINGTIYSFNINTDTINWKFSTEARITASPNYYMQNNNIYILVSSYDGSLYSLSAETGALNWKITTDDFINGSPALSEEYGLIAFGGCDGKLRIADIKKKSEIHNIKLDSYIPASSIITGDKIITASYSNKITAINSQQPYNKLWEYSDTAVRTTYSFSPAVSNDYLLISSDNGYLRVINLETGALIKKKKFDYKIFTPLILKNTVIITDDNGNIFALDLQTLDVMWKNNTGIGFVDGIIPVNDGFAAVDIDGNIYLFSWR